MATIWKSTTKASNNAFTGTTLSSWSRQRKLAMVAGFVILGLLLGVSACSKQSAKPAPVSVSSPATTATIPAVTTTTTAQGTPATPKKRIRPANVTYRDPGSGLSFVYPRKYELTVGGKGQPQFADLSPAPMNFVQPGGVTIATITVPAKAFPGTDFTTAFFNVNINRGLTEEQCSQFAFVDKSEGDGQPTGPEKVKIGSKDMNVITDFAANALKQAEAQYYHSYENRACYEYVLGLATAGFGSESVEPVDRAAVFAKLEKIMATVRVGPQAPEPQVATQTTTSSESTK